MDQSYEVSLVECYRYKVVYPAGVSVRLNPSIDSAKTGEVLKCGTLVEASKSLMLDGVNYIKLSNGKGWVFGKKGDAEILELVKVYRVPAVPHARKTTKRSICESDFFDEGEPVDSVNLSCTPTDTDVHRTCRLRKSDASSNSDKQLNSSVAVIERSSKQRHALRTEQLYWRDIKSKVYDCISCDGFFQLASDAYSASVSLMDGKIDKQKRYHISLLVSITQLSIEKPYLCTDSLISSLWLLLNLGDKASRVVLSLVDIAADRRFEALSQTQRRSLLETLNEVGERSKLQYIELGKLSEVLSDDIKSFHQRWIMISVSPNE